MHLHFPSLLFFTAFNITDTLSDSIMFKFSESRNNCEKIFLTPLPVTPQPVYSGKFNLVTDTHV